MNVSVTKPIHTSVERLDATVPAVPKLAVANVRLGATAPALARADASKVRSA